MEQISIWNIVFDNRSLGEGLTFFPAQKRPIFLILLTCMFVICPNNLEILSSTFKFKALYFAISNFFAISCSWANLLASFKIPGTSPRPSSWRTWAIKSGSILKKKFSFHLLCQITATITYKKNFLSQKYVFLFCFLPRPLLYWYLTGCVGVFNFLQTPFNNVLSIMQPCKLGKNKLVIQPDYLFCEQETLKDLLNGKFKERKFVCFQQKREKSINQSAFAHQTDFSYSGL